MSAGGAGALLEVLRSRPAVGGYVLAIRERRDDYRELVGERFYCDELEAPAVAGAWWAAYPADRWRHQVTYSRPDGGGAVWFAWDGLAVSIRPTTTTEGVQ